MKKTKKIKKYEIEKLIPTKASSRMASLKTPYVDEQFLRRPYGIKPIEVK